MKFAVALVLVIGSSVFAAPTDDSTLKERTKKSPSISHYGAGGYGASYGPPCAGAAPLAPIALYLAPQGAPHYREEEEEQKMHDEHSEHARSYEGASYGASASAVSLAPAAAGGAIGYFPHGNIGPCGVPLLLSCAPSVVAGHLSHSHGYSAPATYKQSQKEEETTELKEAMEMPWAEAQREANNLGPHHHHLEGVFLTGDSKALAEHTHSHNSLIHIS